VKYLREHPSEYVEAASMEVCRDTTHMEKYFQDLLDKGGEGLILRDPFSPLQPGRSSGYLKHKVGSSIFYFLEQIFILFQKYRDAEAKVVGKPGEHQWECELYAGSQFICD